MTLPELNRLFATDEDCREILTRMRWPDGVDCPRCHNANVWWIETRKQFTCSECSYQFSVTTGTIFNDSHLPLATWFMAVLLLVEARKGMSANQLKRTLGVSYKTAWYLCHRIRAAMKEIDQPLLDGTVEVDETYIGGKQHTYSKAGFGDSNKQIVVGIRQRGGDLRFFHAQDVRSGTLANFIRENVSTDVDVIVTDELNAYPTAMKSIAMTAKHKTIKHKAKIYVDGDIHARINKSSGRSFITVEVQHLQSSAREINGDPVRFGVSLICSNGGKIPAEIREIRAVLKPFNTDAIPRKPNLSEAKIFTRQTPLANGTTAALVKEVFTCACKEDVLGDVVLFYGVIKYRDRIVCNRKTCFGYEIDIGGNLQRMRGFPKYNEYT